MRRNLVIGVGGGLLLILGILVGVIVGPSLQARAAGAHAGTAQTQAPKGAYCQLYEQTLVKDLGVSQTQLNTANRDALTQVINQLYADGKITLAQQQQALQQVTQYGAQDPCAALKALATAKAGASQMAPTGAQAQAIMGARSAVVSAVAGALNLTPSQLTADLGQGKTVAQLITAQGVKASTVQSAYLAAIQTQLKQAVSSGALTQAESDAAYNLAQQAASAGHYPLLDKGGANMPGLNG